MELIVIKILAGVIKS